MATGGLEVRIAVSGVGDPEMLAEDAARLRDELVTLDVDDVTELAIGPAPPGSKGLELAALGALVVKLGRSRELLRQVVDTVRDWLHRNDCQSIRVEIDGDVLDLKGVSDTDRKALIDNWIERHSDR